MNVQTSLSVVCHLVSQGNNIFKLFSPLHCTNLGGSTDKFSNVNKVSTSHKLFNPPRPEACFINQPDPLCDKTWLTNLFKDRADCDCSGFECRNVAKLIINGVVALRIPPGQLCSPVDAAGFTWKSRETTSLTDLYAVRRRCHGRWTHPLLGCQSLWRHGLASRLRWPPWCWRLPRRRAFDNGPASGRTSQLDPAASLACPCSAKWKENSSSIRSGYATRTLGTHLS